MKSQWVQETLQFTLLVLELSLIQFHLLWGEFIAFSAANAIHSYSSFHSTRYPSLLGGQRRYGMRGFAWSKGNWLIYHVVPFVWEIVGRTPRANRSSCHDFCGSWNVHLEVPLLMHTLVQPLLAVCPAVCDAAFSPRGNERRAPAW